MRRLAAAAYVSLTLLAGCGGHEDTQIERSSGIADQQPRNELIDEAYRSLLDAYTAQFETMMMAADRLCQEGRIDSASGLYEEAAATARAAATFPNDSLTATFADTAQAAKIRCQIGLDPNH